MAYLGEFAGVNGLEIGNGKLFEVSYSDNGVTLTVVINKAKKGKEPVKVKNMVQLPITITNDAQRSRMTPK